MNGEVKVSVILPVYRVGPYIEKCLDSLRNQTMRELEFIFVDDGSPDDSMARVAEAAAEDDRIIMIENDENIGPGPSRNRGIEVARGEYLSFIDPDDYIAENYMELLYETAKATEADIVKGRCIAVDENEEKVEGWWSCDGLLKKELNKGKPLYLCFTNEHLSALFKRTFIVDDPGQRYGDTMVGEDSVFLLRACLREPSFVMVDDALYFHLIRSDSLEGTRSFERLKEGLKAYEKRIEILDEWSFPEESYTYIRTSLTYYTIRFREYDRTVEDEKQRATDRRRFYDEVNRILARMPEPTKVTDGHKFYGELVDMVAASEPPKKKSLLHRAGKKSFPARLKRKIKGLIRPR